MAGLMVDRILLERILADIKSNVQALRASKDITWDVYRTDIRSRRFDGAYVAYHH